MATIISVIAIANTIVSVFKNVVAHAIANVEFECECDYDGYCECVWLRL